MSFNLEKIKNPAGMWDKPKKFLKKRKKELSPSSSFENPNNLDALNNDMELATNDNEDNYVNSDAETVKVKIPRIVVHCLVINHMEMLNATKKKDFKEDFHVSVRRNQTIRKTKKLEDYNIMIRKWKNQTLSISPSNYRVRKF